MATVEFDEDEWEFFNDDGFICKRKKRPRLDPTPTSSAPPPPDLAAVEKNRRERKKRALIKLRDKYQKEIHQWEHLSNAFKALHDKALTAQQQQQRQQRDQDETTTSQSDLAVDLPQPSGGVLDELIIRVEAEEEIIQDVSNLCDMAEAICNLQEERMKQSLVDLPVWGSPRELMASLCDK